MEKPDKDRIAVVALGGNAITREFEEGNIYQQFANTRKALFGVVELVERGYKLAITHGNGPQVGNALIRVEAARHMVPPVPLGVIVADLEGGMGYMIEQTLQNKLLDRNIDRKVATILTQVLVSKDDPSIHDPVKFVGPFYKENQVESLQEERGYTLKEDSGRGYRRVVPSPHPLAIVEAEIIRQLVHQGVLVIAAGGGGIPVYREKNGSLEGVDAVIDKDLASAVLAHDIGATELYILTAVEKVAVNYRQAGQKFLDYLDIDTAQHYLKEGQFPMGSMGPKIKAAIQFLENGGHKVCICSVEGLADALEGKTGTVIAHNQMESHHG